MTAEVTAIGLVDKPEESCTTDRDPRSRLFIGMWIRHVLSLRSSVLFIFVLYAPCISF